jgi:hypothetical protein
VTLGSSWFCIILAGAGFNGIMEVMFGTAVLAGQACTLTYTRKYKVRHLPQH